MIVREQYEWCNIWWDEANDNLKPRVLLIGDSITLGYRPYVKEILKENINVDMLATSKAVDNPSLLHEINYILGETSFEYKIIHFNNGLHGKHLSKNEYYKWYECVLLHILQRMPLTKLILASSTPIVKMGIPGEIDEESNTIVLERNDIVTELSKKYKLAHNDIYTPMMGRPDLRSNDTVHYNENGHKVQADIVACLIRKILGI